MPKISFYPIPESVLENGPFVHYGSESRRCAFVVTAAEIDGEPRLCLFWVRRTERQLSGDEPTFGQLDYNEVVCGLTFSSLACIDVAISTLSRLRDFAEKHLEDMGEFANSTACSSPPSWVENPKFLEESPRA